MDDFNSRGWSNIHEAAYKGYTIAVKKFLNYAKDTGKLFLIDLKTIDELKETPLLIAALGGSLDCMKVLVDAGSVITETIKYKQKYDHGLVEIAVIRQDINVLLYLYEKFKDVLNFHSRICSLMSYVNNDDEIRASIGRTLEIMTEKTHIGLGMKMRDEFLKIPDFGRYLTIFLKQSLQNPEALASCVLVMVNVFHIDAIRDLFVKNNGINSIIECVDIHRGIINKEIDIYKKLSSNSENDSRDYIDTILNTLETFESCNFVVASLGKCFAEFAKYEKCIEFINKEGYAEKLINFIRLIFDFNSLKSKLLTMIDSGKLLNHKSDSIFIEQYIYTYILFLGTLVVSHEMNRRYFNESFLYEYILNMWHIIQPSLTPHEAKSDRSTIISSVMTSSNYFELTNSTATLSQMLIDQARRKQSRQSVADKNIRAQAFDYVPPYFKDFNNVNTH